MSAIVTPATARRLKAPHVTRVYQCHGNLNSEFSNLNSEFGVLNMIERTNPKQSLTRIYATYQAKLDIKHNKHHHTKLT